MTQKQLDVLNESITNIKKVCSAHNVCIECPMNINCNEFPGEWKTVKNSKEKRQDPTTQLSVFDIMNLQNGTK